MHFKNYVLKIKNANILLFSLNYWNNIYVNNSKNIPSAKSVNLVLSLRALPSAFAPSSQILLFPKIMAK